MASIRLLVVSHTPHYRQGDEIVGWGATVRELDYLARAFDELVHIAPLRFQEPPASSLPYTSGRVRLVPVAPAGGRRLRDKVGILPNIPAWLHAIRTHLPEADVVHVRCPANISMIAAVYLALVPHPPCWIKYAGNWRPEKRDAWSSRFQRWWLNKGLHRGLATINGRWPGQPSHVYSFLNPSLTMEEIESARGAAINKKLETPIRLIFVGRVETAKGVGRSLRILRGLLDRSVQAKLAIVGDGPERPAFESQARSMQLEDHVIFHGWVPHHALPPMYQTSHFILHPSTASEGWPKVLSEAMAYRNVCVTSNISSIPQILEDIGGGVTLPPDDIREHVEAIVSYVKNPAQWHQAAESGQKAAKRFTYEYYLEQLDNMFHQAWGRSFWVPRRL